MALLKIEVEVWDFALRVIVLMTSKRGTIVVGESFNGRFQFFRSRGVGPICKICVGCIFADGSNVIGNEPSQIFINKRLVALKPLLAWCAILLLTAVVGAFVCLVKAVADYTFDVFDLIIKKIEIKYFGE